MSDLRLAPRTYPDIVRDVLTTLAAGVAGEVHAVDYDPTARPVEVPPITLRKRPVKRVSSVRGMVAPNGVADPTDDELLPYDFTLDDYELVPAADDPEALDTIRFRPFAGRLPHPGTDLTVSYYPRTTDPAPITDVQVGSVARTLLEAVSHELAVLYGQLEQAYRSAFVETATGSSLDRVVGLLGYSRARAGRPVGAVRFSRRSGASGTIAIPAGTPITDAKDTVRYETVESRTMLAGESTTEVRVRGADDGTPAVEAGVLTVVQRALAGIDAVTNERPTSAGAADETDEELRARARVALLASNKGTVPAIRNGLLQLPDVRAVTVEELPNGVPGEIRVTVGLADPADAGPAGELPEAVRDRLEELRPAGVRVVSGAAVPVHLAAEVAVMVGGARLAPADVEALSRRVADEIATATRRTGVGQKVRAAPLIAVALADGRAIDASIRLGERDGAFGEPGADFATAAGRMVDLDPADVSVVVAAESGAHAEGAEVVVTVRAVLVAHPVDGTAPAEVEAQIRARLDALLRQPAPGTALDAPALLAALRDDTRYGLDPLGLRIAFSAGEQFVEVAQGGAAFTVGPDHRFEVASVEVQGPSG